jgi:hypothetical protein
MSPFDPFLPFTVRYTSAGGLPGYVSFSGIEGLDHVADNGDNLIEFYLSGLAPGVKANVDGDCDVAIHRLRTFPCPTAGLLCHARTMPGGLSKLSLDKCDPALTHTRGHENGEHSGLPR